MMEPDVIGRRDGIQLSYNLPHLLNDVCVYPQKSNNGSTVIICAHDEGLRLMWYAGKKLKQKTPPRVNGSSIDLTDEIGTPADQYEEEDEFDSTQPFHTVLKDVEINLGAAALKLAVPPLPADTGDEFHPILKSHAIVLVACADLSLRLVMVPLGIDRDQKSEIQRIALTGANSHQDLVSDVAITITPFALEADDTRQSRTRSRSRGRGAAEAAPGSKDWSILLASTSPTGTGLLLIHQIPIQENGQISSNSDDLVPLQRRFLRCSLVKCRISFNPSLYPSARCTNLLIAPSDGSAVKIYQAISATGPTKKRRGSTATTDSATSLNQSAKRSIFNDKVLIDLHTPFRRHADQDLSPRRKRVLDAKWVLHGRAVLVLLEDGEWGIWDVEGSGPTAAASSTNLVKGQGNVTGVQGGSLTKFALKGSVSLGVATRKSTSNGAQSRADSSLAPMTPHTRKTRSQGLFKGPDQTAPDNMPPSSQPQHGCLAVAVQSHSNRTTVATNSMPRSQDECVMFSYGTSSILIPSIQSYWRSEKSENGMFDGPAGARAIVLPHLQTAGEEARNIQVLAPTTGHSQGRVAVSTKLTHEFLVATSSRLVVFTQALAERTVPDTVQPVPMRPLADASTKQDQILLDSGELDIEGMDRILDSMANSGTIPSSMATSTINSLIDKSVGFQVENDDEDVQMDTPTTSKGSRSQLILNKGWPNQGGPRRLFT